MRSRSIARSRRCASPTSSTSSLFVRGSASRARRGRRRSSASARRLSPAGPASRLRARLSAAGSAATLRSPSVLRRPTFRRGSPCGSSPRSVFRRWRTSPFASPPPSSLGTLIGAERQYRQRSAGLAHQRAGRARRGGLRRPRRARRRPRLDPSAGLCRLRHRLPRRRRDHEGRRQHPRPQHRRDAMVLGRGRRGGGRGACSSRRRR